MSFRVHPRSASRAVAALALMLSLALLSPGMAHAFQVFRHSSMTAEVLGRQGVSGNTLKMILQGTRWPDLNQCRSGCYCPEIVFYCDPSPSLVNYFSPFHFDNNKLFEGREHVEFYMNWARDGLAGPIPTTDAEREQVGKSFLRFGIALHAIQDFYAHSTWVENNRDLVRIGGRIDSAPLWNGEDHWGTGTTDVAGVTVAGVQTGYERLPTPPGSVSHAALNKDHANTTQGQIAVNRIFPFGLIGTYYEIASGQNGASGGSYRDLGLAPRHTIHAWQCLSAGCAIYQLPPVAPVPAGRDSEPTAARAALDVASLMAWANSDPGMGQLATYMDSVWTAAVQDSPQAFPAELFDPDGWPLPATTSVDDLIGPEARLLSPAWPNPTRGHVSIRFRLPRAGHVSLEMFDPAGRRVATLLDRHMEPGWKDVVWDGAHGSSEATPTGSYLCRLRAGDRTETCRVSLIR